MSRKHFVTSTLSLAVALSLAGPDALAMGIGGLRVQSALNQPFAGEIDLLDVKPDELDSIKAQIASAEAFSKAGAERYHHLTKLRFTPQISPRGKTVLRVSSREPIREPYMDFLLEVQWPNGRVVKEYMVLLDPPATSGRSTPPIEQPVAQPRYVPAASETPLRPAERPVERPRRIASSPPSDTAPAPIPAGVSTAGFPKYIGPVKSGSGLWRLAVRNVPQGATAAQTAMALYRNNQGAFSNGNINRLSAGKTLVIPSVEELFALNPAEAQQEYQAALRGENVRRAPIVPGAPGDRLKIAGAPLEDKKDAGSSVAAPGPEGMEQELLLVREASESTRQETQEMRGRIRELETQLSEIQKLLQLRNAELARIQQGAPGQTESAAAGAATPPGPDSGVQTGLGGAVQVPGGVPPEDPAVAVGEGSTPSPEPAPGSLPSEGFPPAGEGAPGGPVIAESALGAATATGPEPLPVSTAPTLPLQTPDSTQVPPAVSETGPDVAATTEPKSAQPARTEATPPGQLAGDSTWHALLLPLAGIAGVTALGIGALTWWRSRGRRREEDFTAEIDSVESVDAIGAGASWGVGSEVGQKAKGMVVAGSEDVGGVQTGSSAIGALGRTESETDDTDVISEADIYIAYGRFREAEDLLRDEIRHAPRRLDLKLKLADALFGAKNRPAIEALIQEIKAGPDRIPADQLQRLAEMAESIQSDDDPPGDLSPGLRVVAPARGTAPASADRRAVDDSFDAVSKEVFSLDISDKQGAVAERLGLGRGRDSRTPVSESKPFDLGSDHGVLSPSAAGRRPVEPPLGDDGPLVMDEEVFSRHLGLDEDSEDLDIDLTPNSGPSAHRSGSEQSKADFGGGPAKGVSDLELNIDDLWAASDVDLESFVDATQLDHKGSEPTSGHFESRTGRGQPTPLRPVAPEASGGQRPSAMTGLFGGQDESGSSDLLTSQWQMDSGLWDEIATKLDLARAYIEMGDKESAKGILEEVVGEGNEEQRAEASELLRRVG